MKVILLILDGWGVASPAPGNAIALAKLPTLTSLANTYPSGLLNAFGIAVGLPWGEPGNSEVGHITIGSGRTVLQSMPRIIKAIQDGSFFKNDAFLKAVANTKTHSSQFHIMGLIGTGSVHSYIDHLYGLLELASREGISSQVKLHLFLDGRDSPPTEGLNVLKNLSMRLSQTGQGSIASIIGRDYAMDRDYNWEKIEATYNLLVKGAGRHALDPLKAVEEYYAQGLTDSNIPPTIIMNEQDIPQGLISPHDSVIFFNYREDSARQLTKAFVLPKKVPFAPEVPFDIFFATMTEYEKDFPCQAAFKSVLLNNTIPQVLSAHKKTQIHIAETEKYAHITYFFNGMREDRYPGEDWVLIPSMNSAEFASKPEFRVPEITQVIVESIEAGKHDFLLANFASPDLLAHTGDLPATIKACEIIDTMIKEILSALQNAQAKGEDWACIITSDHGHAETVRDPLSGKVLTGHTSNNVPLYLFIQKVKKEASSLDAFGRKNTVIGMLSDIAPTILDLLNIPKPQEMTGTSLIPQFGISLH